MSSLICTRCQRPLKQPSSVQHGMGPVCYAKSKAAAGGEKGDDQSTVAELPFDPETCDVVCARVGGTRLDNPDWAKRQFNVGQAVVVHSPTGFEWGYGGSGPADFALNVLNLFAIRFFGQKPDFQAGRGAQGRCCQVAWDLHQDFKREFVARLPEEGGTIKGSDIKGWMAARLPGVQAA